MKRIVICLLIIALMASIMLTACGKPEDQPTGGTEPVETVGTQPTDPTPTETDPTQATDSTEAPNDPTEAPATNPTEGTEPTETEPSVTPTEPAPTEAPTQAPTQVPTQAPTQKPTVAPTQAPTQKPTQAPTQKPTQAPTQKPTVAPTQAPTQAPTRNPILKPTLPTRAPTQAPTEPADTITITGPTGEVYGYADNAKNYLLSDGDRVDRYKNPYGQKSAVKAIDITWTANFTPDTFTVRYGTDKNLSGCNEITVDGTKNSISVYNLLKGTTYYVEVSAQSADSGKVVAKSTFTTTSVGPRVMYIETLYNVRDMGGYATSDGKVTKQNMIFRGDALVPCAQSNANLSDAGKAFMSQELGIKLEIDFRTPSEAKYDGTTSVIPGARLEYITLSAYSDCFNKPDGYAEVFKALADVNNYPIYMHCTGGADRTGTVAFLLNALLGVDYDVLIQDYEFTNFAPDYGARSAEDSQFFRFESVLDSYAGKNLSEQVENYLLSIGVTQNEINSIKTIMKG